MIVLGSLVGAALGMTLGTFVPPRRIEIVFAVTLTPLMFTGATQFPWLGLADLRWFQVVCAANPSPTSARPCAHWCSTATPSSRCRCGSRWRSWWRRSWASASPASRDS
ncbi:hypothetical protein ACFQVA_40675 [Actinomadura keratinilytica]